MTTAGNASGTSSAVTRLLAYGLTEVGKVRKHNEDAIGLNDAARIWVVADGMGGHEAGDYASQRIVEVIEGLADGDLVSRVQAVEEALQSVNTELVKRGKEKGGKTIGSTVIACIADGTHCVIAWAGDSRAYIFRGGLLEQINEDHSFVGELVRAGTITEAEAEVHPAANVVTRAVGGDARLSVDYQYEELRVGDRIMLCSDGVSKEIPALTIAEILGSAASAQQACEAMRDQVFAGRASDNLSVIVIEAQGDPTS